MVTRPTTGPPPAAFDAPGYTGHVYKRDARTVVFAALGPNATDWVVKQYLASPWRQSLAWTFRIHPVQRESRAAARLEAAGFPVVTIAAWGFDPATKRGWLATPFVGPAMPTYLKSADKDAAERATAQVVAIADRLADAGWLHRDFKANNLVVDAHGRPHMIDTGDTRKVSAGQRDSARRRMLTLLHKTLSDADAPVACVETVADRLSEMSP